MPVKRTCLLYWLLLVGCTAASIARGQSLKFLHYTIEDGLPSSLVYNGLQDKEGFIWFATESGLTRFDGTSFVNYTTESGLPANTVLHLKESKYGHLWISCYNEGLCYMKDGRVYSAKNDSTLAKMVFQNGASSVIEGMDYIYAYDQGSFIYKCIFDKKTGLIESIYNTKKMYGSKQIFVIANNTYILNGNNVLLIDSDTLKNIHRFEYPSIYGGIVSHKIPIIDIAGNLFFYGLDNNIKICTINDGGHIEERFFDRFNHKITTIKCVDAHTVWIQVAEEGLYKISTDDAGNIKNKTKIKGINNVNHILKDREGTVWFCTAGNGIFALPSERNMFFDARDGLPSNRIQSIETLPHGKLLVGDDNGNLISIQKSKVSHVKKLKTEREFNRVLHIKYDSMYRDTWVATDGGLFVLSSKKEEKMVISSAMKALYNSRASVFSSHPIVLTSIDKHTKKIKELRRGEKITAITEDENQNLWLGKLNGLEILRKDSSRVYLEKIFPDLLQTRITGLARANDNYIWVATHQNGVVGIKSDLSNRIHFSTDNGLSSNICQNIYLDGDGDIWVCTNNGLNKITRKDLSIQHFSTVNVLPDDDVNDVRVVGDTVWVATAGGLAVFIDDGIKTDAQYATLVSGLLANNVPKPIHHHALVRLPQDSCDLQFQFSALSFRSNGRFTYHYSIERVYPSLAQLTWDDVGHFLKTLFTDAAVATQGMITKGNTLQWSNTEVGRYRLNVVAVSFDKVKSALPDHLEFHVQPLFYQCLWFHLLCISLIIGLLRWLYIRQTNRNERDLRLQQELTSLKLEAFKAQINPHFVFNTINGIQRFFFPPDPAKANEYIVLFSSLVRKSIEFSEKTTLPFHMELEFLKDYLELTRLRVGERFEYHIEGDGDIPGQLAVPTMLLQPLVENAIVHGFPPSGKAVLKVLFTVEAGRCICRIEDNGIGINASKAKRRASGDTRTSKGTSLVMQRVDALNQIERQQIRVSVTDKNDLGTAHSGTVAEVSFLLKTIYHEKNQNSIYRG